MQPKPGGKRVPIEDIHHHRRLANENISHLGDRALSLQASLSNIITIRHGHATFFLENRLE